MSQRRRMIGLVVVLVVAVGLMSSGTLHALIANVVSRAGVVISNHPQTGVLLFVALSAVSAMAAFVSTAVIVPVAVYEWGRETTFVLLWVSWLAGGCCTYAIGRTLGRRVASWFTSPARVDYYTARMTTEGRFLTVLLFQLAVPSEIPGYVLGAVRYRFVLYFTALALAEIPFAAGAVYLGEGFLQRNYALIVILGGAGLALTAVAFRCLHRRIEGPAGSPVSRSSSVPRSSSGSSDSPVPRSSSGSSEFLGETGR